MKKIIFRILGALSSALIIVAVFVPFVSVTGFSQSLWQAHEATGTLYLPIMIIVFGAIGVIFFSINIKTELAYTSSGALLFFLITQTIPIIDQGTFKSLSVGYYFLAVGAVLTGIMAFLCNLKVKVKVVETVQEPKKEESVLNQIDKLYDNHVSNDVEVSNELNDIIQPLQPISALVSNQNEIPVQNSLTQPINQENSVEGTNEIPTQNTLNDQLNPNTNNESFNQNSAMEEESLAVPTQVQNMDNIPSNKEVETSVQANAVVSELSQAPAPEAAPVQANPGVSEFSQAPAPEAAPVQANPVVSEFSTAGPNGTFITPPQGTVSEVTETPTIEELQPIGSGSKVDVMASPTSKSDSNLDIFG